MITPPTTMYMEKLLFRPREVAEGLGLGLTFTYKLIASGEIPSIRIGKSVRVPADGLREWVQRRVAGQLASEQVAVG